MTQDAKLKVPNPKDYDLKTGVGIANYQRDLQEFAYKFEREEKMRAFKHKPGSYKPGLYPDEPFTPNASCKKTSPVVPESTGKASRYNSGKPKLSFVLEAYHALCGAARVFEFGATKYARSNWRKGLPMTEVCDSMGRHLSKFLAGEDLDLNKEGGTDKDHSGLPHVDHILANALFLSEFYHTDKKRLDDRGTSNDE